MSHLGSSHPGFQALTFQYGDLTSLCSRGKRFLNMDYQPGFTLEELSGEGMRLDNEDAQHGSEPSGRVSTGSSQYNLG